MRAISPTMLYARIACLVQIFACNGTKHKRVQSQAVSFTQKMFTDIIFALAWTLFGRITFDCANLPGEGTTVEETNDTEDRLDLDYMLGIYVWSAAIMYVISP